MTVLPLQAQTMEENFFEPGVSGVRMYYREQGQGELTLLMIHGLGSTSAAFQKLEALTASYAKTVVIDLPGYGKSEAGTFEAGMKNYAALIADFVRSRNYKNVVLAGHSMGGQIAMTAALDQQNATWLKGLFLMAPAGVETFSDSDRQWFSTYVTPEIMAMVSDDQLKRNFDVNFATGKLPEDAVFMYEERLNLKNDKAGYEAYLNTVAANVQAMLNEPVAAKIAEISQPVLMVYGKQDYLIPNKLLHPELTMEDLKTSISFSHSQSKFITVDNAGHFLVWEQPEKINALIKSFTEIHQSK